uniref:hypothetical protein n=1 Tax=Microbacterium proteolyticum TaxID=1572644 RepID=UPI0024174276|nr:hypothetical protein [Microbacterium proteolyticum]
MTRDAAEVIVRAQFYDQYIDEQYTQILDDAAEADPDREMVASGLWLLGAGLEHIGCIYGPPEPADGDYSCACEQCWTHLLAVADRIIAAVHEPSVQEPEHTDGGRDG